MIRFPTGQELLRQSQFMAAAPLMQAERSQSAAPTLEKQAFTWITLLACAIINKSLLRLAPR
jgi:hypothetical protein